MFRRATNLFNLILTRTQEIYLDRWQSDNVLATVFIIDVPSSLCFPGRWFICSIRTHTQTYAHTHTLAGVEVHRFVLVNGAGWKSRMLKTFWLLDCLSRTGSMVVPFYSRLRRRFSEFRNILRASRNEGFSKERLEMVLV